MKLSKSNTESEVVEWLKEFGANEIKIIRKEQEHV